MDIAVHVSTNPQRSARSVLEAKGACVPLVAGRCGDARRLSRLVLTGFWCHHPTGKRLMQPMCQSAKGLRAWAASVAAEGPLAC